MAKDATKTQESDPGSNVNRDTFLQAVTGLREIDDRLNVIKEERKRYRKKLKHEGIELGELDAVVKLADTTHKDVRGYFDRLHRYARFLALPTGTTAEMFEDKSADDIDRMDWRSEGATAGMMGKEGSPPDHCPAEFHQAFMDGYASGQAARAEAMPEVAKEMKKAGAKDGSREKTPEPA
ncbi:hypothetical protein [Marinicauda sp. Alg238-R41]|uniref:hypothetical protein n=1 Tax=Marinicauda sp. Alg238-R41 TaxID=2993447 RepID=UPI0022E13922|nr:hypothetical protein [Marinicauda sp. Alg238-R41]